MTIQRRIKRFFNRFDYLRTYNSPFKPLRIKWYFGKVAIGTPYFLPRRWVDSKINPGYLTPVPKQIGFDFVSLGWKTKWDSYRHEWNPLLSFVFFKWQAVVMFVPDHDSHYWECWLHYTRDTNKFKSVEERIAQCRKFAPCEWTNSKNGVTSVIDYYDVILKDKYVNKR